MVAKVIVKQSFLRALESTMGNLSSNAIHILHPGGSARRSGPEGVWVTCARACNKSCPLYGEINQLRTDVRVSWTSPDPQISLDRIEFVEQESVGEGCILNEWEWARHKSATLHFWALRLYSIIVALTEKEHKED